MSVPGIRALTASVSGWSEQNWSFGGSTQLPQLKYVNEPAGSCGGSTEVTCGAVIPGQNFGSIIGDWYTSEWGDCPASVSCGVGTQSRTVACDYDICGDAEPPYTEPPSTQPCSRYSVSACCGGWGGCSASCGGGWRYRSCQSNPNNYSTSRRCNTHSCCVSNAGGSCGCGGIGTVTCGGSCSGGSCPSGSTCSGGSCVIPPRPCSGSRPCGSPGSCYAKVCGVCGGCPPGQTCNSSNRCENTPTPCDPLPSPGSINCGSRECGVSGTYCSSGTCNSSNRCENTPTPCDPLPSPGSINCGSSECGVSGTYCSSGTCNSSNRCENTPTPCDPLPSSGSINCGSSECGVSGTYCSSGTCSGGRCVSTPHRWSNYSTCTATDCGSSARQTRSCSAVGHTHSDESRTCYGTSCPSGQTCRNESCVPMHTSPNWGLWYCMSGNYGKMRDCYGSGLHIGHTASETVTCLAGSVCSSSQCVDDPCDPLPSSGSINCGSSECGVSGTYCSSGTCSGGSCVTPGHTTPNWGSWSCASRINVQDKNVVKLQGQHGGHSSSEH